MFVTKASCQPLPSLQGCSSDRCCRPAAGSKLCVEQNGLLWFPPHSSPPLCWCLGFACLRGRWAPPWETFSLQGCGSASASADRWPAQGHPDRCVFGPFHPVHWALNREFCGGEQGTRVRGCQGGDEDPHLCFPTVIPQMTPVSTL